MIAINTSFSPLRLVLSRREPIQLKIRLDNRSEEEKKLTMKVLLSSELSFERGGYRNSVLERVDSISPGGEKTFYYELFGKQSTRVGEQPILIKIQEHFKNYEYTQNEYSKKVNLVVSE